MGKGCGKFILSAVHLIHTSRIISFCNPDVENYNRKISHLIFSTPYASVFDFDDIYARLVQPFRCLQFFQ